MDFFSLLGVMVRRWFVVLPVLLVALVAGLAFIGSPAERYTAEGSELLGVRSEADPESLGFAPDRTDRRSDSARHCPRTAFHGSQSDR